MAVASRAAIDGSLQAACDALVSVSNTIAPDPALTALYEERYQQFRHDRNAERLDPGGVQLAIRDLVLLRQQENELTGTDIDLDPDSDEATQGAYVGLAGENIDIRNDL